MTKEKYAVLCAESAWETCAIFWSDLEIASWENTDQTTKNQLIMTAQQAISRAGTKAAEIHEKYQILRWNTGWSYNQYFDKIERWDPLLEKWELLHENDKILFYTLEKLCSLFYTRKDADHGE